MNIKEDFFKYVSRSLKQVCAADTVIQLDAFDDTTGAYGIVSYHTGKSTKLKQRLFYYDYSDNSLSFQVGMKRPSQDNLVCSRKVSGKYKGDSICQE